MSEHIRAFAILSASLLLAALPAKAEAPSGTFAVVSDIHFDPFDPPDLAVTLLKTGPQDWAEHFEAIADQPASQWGSDTNYTLFKSALAAIGETAAEVDFVIAPGDSLSHHFGENAAKVLNTTVRSQAHQVLARRTTLFVANALATALPDKPILVAFGNNDSQCGDYEIEPDGAYLAATQATVRKLAGDDLLAADFDETYPAGGYYAARHPTAPDTLIIVLNDVMWSPKYKDSCGPDSLQPAHAQMDWLARTLAAQKAAGGRVWMMHHIPWGMDSFSTEHAKAGTCPATVIRYLAEPFATELYALVAQYADIIDASLSGHVHSDDFRLMVDAAGNAVAAEKVSPAISPIYNQNPAFQIFDYDVKTGVPNDYTSYYLANLPEVTRTVPGDWKKGYVFSQAYGLGPYSTESIANLWKGLDKPGPIRDAYVSNYGSRHGGFKLEALKAYACAVGFVDVEAYTSCYCGK